jgi:hypothetical protein
VNALADGRVAEYINENFVATYLKVGTFQIINGQKVGGNVASYFCLPDSSVLHAVPGKVDGARLLSEARWAYETRKSALTLSTDLVSGVVDQTKYQVLVQQAHVERYQAEGHRGPGIGRRGKAAAQALPADLPRGISQQGQAHWVLAHSPLERLERIYPFVWQEILREQLSGLPVAQR